MSIGKRPHKIDVQYDGTKHITTELKDGKVELSTSEDSIDYKSAVNIQDPKSENPNADWLHTIKDFAGNIIMGIDRYGRSFWYGTSGFASGIMQFFSNGKLYAIFSTDGGDGFFKLFNSNNEEKVKLSSSEDNVFGMNVQVPEAIYPEHAVRKSQLDQKVDKSTILKIGEVEYDLSQNRTFPIPIGSGGYEANVYMSATDSVTAGYKKLLYSPDVSETLKTITANNNTEQGEKYLYDAQIGTDIIPSGEWKFKLYGKLSAVSGGTTTVNIRVFRYDTSGIEHDILTASKLITNTVNDTIQFTATQSANIACDLTDVIGIQISLTTTRNQNTTFFYSLGDGYAAYFVTTLPYRHQLLRDLLWLLSGHKGTANFIAMFDEFGNAKESNQINVKNATFLTEYDNGDSGVAKTIDWNNGQNQKITLTANCVLTLPSVTGTGRFQLKVIQDGTGARSLSFTSASVKNPTNFDFASGTANQECIITFYWDGAKYIFLSIPYYS